MRMTQLTLQMVALLISLLAAILILVVAQLSAPLITAAIFLLMVKVVERSILFRLMAILITKGLSMHSEKLVSVALSLLQRKIPIPLLVD